MLKRGEVVKGRWVIEERLGKGTFCELHRASDRTEKSEGAAVKVEVQGMQRSVLKVGWVCCVGLCGFDSCRWDGWVGCVGACVRTQYSGT